MSAILFLPLPRHRRRSNSMIAHASWTGSRRTQQPSCRSATEHRSRSDDTFLAAGDGIVNSLDNAVDSAASQSPIAQSDESGNTPNSKSAKKRRTPLIVAGVVALLLACGAGGWAWWYYQGPGSYWTMPQPDGMTCDASAACPITNVKWSDYESLLKISDIEYEVSEEYSDSVEEGNIISTDPANVGDRGSKRRSQKVKVVVSKGVRQATVPADILDATSASGKDPINALKKAGFDNVEQTAASDDTYSIDVPQGALLSLSVDPGATLPHNTTITVTVSPGAKASHYARYRRQDEGRGTAGAG